MTTSYISLYNDEGDEIVLSLYLTYKYQDELIFTFQYRKDGYSYLKLYLTVEYEHQDNTLSLLMEFDDTDEEVITRSAIEKAVELFSKQYFSIMERLTKLYLEQPYEFMYSKSLGEYLEERWLI